MWLRPSPSRADEPSMLMDLRSSALGRESLGRLTLFTARTWTTRLAVNTTGTTWRHALRVVGN